ncbi:MAG: PD-(D/E)XK nuclease family protein, partial [Alphaproteobacteria bacterium]|nr:PD-(D/E)XK nuclease family protein [Alphaproteobacteria bacterium]
AKALCAEAAGVLEAPALAHVFAEDALTEVEITARIGRLEGRVVLGAIDRLIIEESRVLAVDFKSNEIVPERPALVPEGILRQMGAYAAALEKLYPGKTVETAIIWTRAAAFMPLSHETVISALDRTTTS